MAKGAVWRLAAPPPAAPPAAAAGAAAAAASGRPSSCNRFVLNRIQKGRQASGQHVFLEVVPSFSSMVFRCGEGCILEACSTSSSSTTSSSSRSSSSSRPSSCNRFVLNRIQKGPEGTSSLGAACFWRSFRPSVAWCFGSSSSRPSS